MDICRGNPPYCSKDVEVSKKQKEDEKKVEVVVFAVIDVQGV